MDRSRLVAVIPAHNEAATVASVVRVALRHANVIVVDDGSSDDTSAAAESAGAIVVRNAQNLGYESSLNRGFEEALASGFEYIVTMDADGEHDPQFLKEFARSFTERQLPLVLGRRRRKQRWAEVMMGLYVRLRFSVHDITCGMKGYRADLVRQNGGFDSGHSVGTELAIRSIRSGHDFHEIRITGTRRRDAPRFGGGWRSNRRILRALWQVMLDDMEQLIARIGFGRSRSPADDQSKRSK